MRLDCKDEYSNKWGGIDYIFYFFKFPNKLIENISKNWLNAPGETNYAHKKLHCLSIHFQNLLLVHEWRERSDVVKTLKEWHKNNKMLGW